MRLCAYAALVLLSVVVRVAWIVHAKPFEEPQGAEMELAARSLAKDGYIGHIFEPQSLNGTPSAHVAPLYPMMVGSMFRIFGWNTLAGRGAQEALAIIGTVLGFALLPTAAQRLRLPRAAGWMAAFGLALLPINLWVEASGGWEQPYSALILLSIVLLFCRAIDERWRNRGTLLWIGLAVGVATLLSPPVVPAAVLMGAGALITARGLRVRVALAGVVVAVVASALVTPWIVRNWFALGGFVPVRSNFGLELAMGNNPHANGTTLGTTLEDPNNLMYRYHPSSNSRERSRLMAMGELAYMREKQQQALQWIRAHPADTAWLTVRRCFLYWFPPADLWGTVSPAAIFKSVIIRVITAAAVLSLGWLLYSGHDRAWLMAGALIGPSVSYMVTHVDIRYRYPITGLSTVLAAHLAVLAYRTAVARRRTRRHAVT